MFKRILLVIVLCVVVAAGTVGYLYLKPTAEASQPITAIPVAGTATPSSAVGETAVSTAGETVGEQPAATAADTTTEPAAAGQVSTAVVFEIIPEASEVRFIIDEVLNGAPTTVVGTTGQVAGQIAVVGDTASATQVGVIQINARTLTTDSEMRNRALGNRILFTDQYEYITFTPTAVSGLPETITVGEMISFQIAGDLTIRDVTLPVTFAAQVTPVSETRLEGSASATIRYADFDIAIPQVPSVTWVDEEVVLEINFTAEPV